MKYSEITTKTPSELLDIAYNLKKGMYALRVQKKLNQLSNTAQIRAHRKDLARVIMKLAEINKQKV